MNIIIIIFSFLSVLAKSYPTGSELEELLNKISLPDGFKIDIYASDVENARSMTISPSGTVFVGNRKADNVFALMDNDKDGKVDKKYLITDKLTNMPNGVVFTMVTYMLPRLIKFGYLKMLRRI